MGDRNQLITDIGGVFEGLFQRKHGEIKGDVAEAIWISLKIRTCTCINTFKKHSVHFCGMYIYIHVCIYNIYLHIYSSPGMGARKSPYTVCPQLLFPGNASSSNTPILCT